MQNSIVVYDITREETFTRAKDWVEELRKFANSDIVIALVGNKADLDDKRMVANDEAGKYARRIASYLWKHLLQQDHSK